MLEGNEANGNRDGYVIMPCTYESSKEIQGPFMVAVSTTVEFALTQIDVWARAKIKSRTEHLYEKKEDFALILREVRMSTVSAAWDVCFWWRLVHYSRFENVMSVRTIVSNY